MYFHFLTFLHQICCGCGFWIRALALGVGHVAEVCNPPRDKEGAASYSATQLPRTAEVRGQSTSSGKKNGKDKIRLS